MWRNIVSQAIPLTLAQLVQLLYNVVDRIYIGHLPGADSMALTGIGLTFPITTFIAAFTCLFGTGGTPLFSIARGAKEEARAEKIMGNVFTLLVSSSLVIFVLCYMFRKPVLYLFGASDASYAYADAYLKVYLLGTIFSMLSTGMNGFINFFGFFFMAFQFVGQSTFTALGRSKHAIFFSLLRKAVIVAPLTLLLPQIGNLGVHGVFLAEPISNAIGGLACVITMYFTVYRRLGKEA